jgi:hypothetical protein
MPLTSSSGYTSRIYALDKVSGMVGPRHGKALFVAHGGITPWVGELNMLAKQRNRRKIERKVNSTTSFCVKKSRLEVEHARTGPEAHGDATRG